MPSKLFSYTIGRKFPWEWFTAAVFIVSIPVLIGLGIFNYYEGGFEVVNHLSSNPNSSRILPIFPTYKHPEGIKFLDRSSGPCDEAFFLKGQTFNSNNSMFQYTLRSVINSNGQAAYGVDYMNNPLTNCSVYMMDLNGNQVIGTFTMTTEVMCQLAISTIYFRSEFEFSLLPDQDDIDGFIAPGVANLSLAAEPAQTVLAVIDVITTDFETAVEAYARESLEYLDVYTTVIPCDNGVSNGCYNDVYFSIFPTYKFLNGTVSYDEPPSLDATIANLYQVFYNAILIDLGNFSPENIFLSPQALSAALIPNTYIDDLPKVDYVPSWFSGTEEASSWATAILHNDTVAAQLGLPITIEYYQEYATILTQYSCPTWQKKTTGALAEEILVGTSSLWLSIWGFAIFFMTHWASKRPENKHCEGCAEVLKRLDGKTSDKDLP